MTGKILGLPCQSASYPLALARNAVFEKPRSGPALEGDWQTGKVLSLVKVEEEVKFSFIKVLTSFPLPVCQSPPNAGPERGFLKTALRASVRG